MKMSRISLLIFSVLFLFEEYYCMNEDYSYLNNEGDDNNLTNEDEDSDNNKLIEEEQNIHSYANSFLTRLAEKDLNSQYEPPSYEDLINNTTTKPKYNLPNEDEDSDNNKLIEEEQKINTYTKSLLKKLAAKNDPNQNNNMEIAKYSSGSGNNPVVYDMNPPVISIPKHFYTNYNEAISNNLTECALEMGKEGEVTQKNRSCLGKLVRNRKFWIFLFLVWTIMLITDGVLLLTDAIALHRKYGTPFKNIPAADLARFHMYFYILLGLASPCICCCGLLCCGCDPSTLAPIVAVLGNRNREIR